MNAGAHPPGETGKWTRRGFIGITGVAAGVAASAIAAPEASAVTDSTSLSDAQQAMVLRLARTVAVFPMLFPTFEGPGKALSYATSPRLVAADQRMHPVRRAYARTGSEILLSEGLLESDPVTMLDRIAVLSTDPGYERPIIKVTGLAIATLSKRLAPTSDGLAPTWLACVRQVRRQGRLARLAKNRGLT